ncbi:phosphoribosyltransferase [Ancylobacter novellus DSM 506]|uniref:Phosphoribosyltransferase n=1 Tax=Ancylobacter novellus (strain ATCC 8093 / DSM 506 / JCM 20403 / CCM 1077 / IAM 12100 / NBRC 12443 / NCIMB 10456) TaxID=639283 RepID=D7A7Q9_ANCN5|nr:phosphoribosyltransferase [Ancylobacter novellus]ADH88507.1 phosphoribosyltransferase [Ancylobacter novellus DSM 506]
MMFADRVDAGRRLAEALAIYRQRHPVVLALPRGGVPVAAEVAQALGAPLDLLLVRKIGLPWQRELAIGAVVDGADPLVVRNEAIIAHAQVSEAAFQRACREEMAEIERRKTRYLGGRARAPLAGRVVIVVDDGIATGATMRAALRAIRQRGPSRLVLAVPVAAADSLSELRPEVDDIVCLDTPEPFRAIGCFYRDFSQVSDEEVIAALERFPTGVPSDGG